MIIVIPACLYWDYRLQLCRKRKMSSGFCQSAYRKKAVKAVMRKIFYNYFVWSSISPVSAPWHGNETSDIPFSESRSAHSTFRDGSSPHLTVDSLSWTLATKLNILVLIWQLIVWVKHSLPKLNLLIMIWQFLPVVKTSVWKSGPGLFPIVWSNTPLCLDEESEILTNNQMGLKIKRIPFRESRVKECPLSS